MVLFGRAPVPDRCLARVPVHALAPFVQRSETELRRCVPRLRGPPVPPGGLGKVLLGALPALHQLREIVLGLGVFLPGRPVEPVHGGHAVLNGPQPVGVHHGNEHLRDRIAPFRVRDEVAQCAPVVSALELRDTLLHGLGVCRRARAQQEYRDGCRH